MSRSWRRFQPHNSRFVPLCPGGDARRAALRCVPQGAPAPSSPVPALTGSAVNPCRLTRIQGLAPSASLPARRAPYQSSCRSGSAGPDGGTFLRRVPALVEAFSLEWQPAGSWPEWQGSSGGSVGKSGRKAAPCGEWQESRPASRRLCAPGGAGSPPAPQARPGISELRPQLLLTAKYFTPETCYTS